MDKAEIDRALNAPFPEDASIAEIIEHQKSLNLAGAAIARQARQHIDKQNARINRLREALSEITNLPDDRCDEASSMARLALDKDY